MICVAVGMLLLMAILRVFVEARRRSVPMPRLQVARLLALVLLTLSVGFTEIAVAGSAATPRLLLNVIALTLGLYGVWGIRQKQKLIPPNI